MDTGTDHISISIREFDTYNLSIGRVKEPEKGVALVNADIRGGRTMAQRRTLTLGYIELLNRSMNIPKEHIYVTLNIKNRDLLSFSLAGTQFHFFAPR